MHNNQIGSPQPSIQSPSVPWCQSTPLWWRQSALQKSQAAPPWHVKLPAMRPPIWPTVIGALAALALLFAFHKVVAQVVVQADLERTQTAASYEIAWNCKLMELPRDRDACLAQVSAAHQLRTLSASTQAVQALALAGMGGRDQDDETSPPLAGPVVKE